MTMKTEDIVKAAVDKAIHSCIVECCKIENREWNRWKDTGDIHAEGQSDGASDCAFALTAIDKRGLLEEILNSVGD